MVHIYCRSSDAEDVEFNICELAESTEMKSAKKQSIKATRQSDGRFGVGDTVTVVASMKIDAENKVSMISVYSAKLNLQLYVCQ